ncbi:YegP family protein [Methanococcoides sp. FTZ1]|uniref:YegP family protein n=1 Tax=Methanococcoides sp. FTZ1 TaxID=3439061 RepID=UPI003F86B1B6
MDISTAVPHIIINRLFDRKGENILKFEIYADKSGKYRFRLKARNGEIIATGQSYSTKAACMNGIQSIKKNAADAEIIEIETPSEEK